MAHALILFFVNWIVSNKTLCQWTTSKENQKSKQLDDNNDVSDNVNTPQAGKEISWLVYIGNDQVQSVLYRDQDQKEEEYICCIQGVVLEQFQKEAKDQ
jgi:hypothetical protein